MPISLPSGIYPQIIYSFKEINTKKSKIQEKHSIPLEATT